MSLQTTAEVNFLKGYMVDKPQEVQRCLIFLLDTADNILEEKAKLEKRVRELEEIRKGEKTDGSE